MRRRVIPVIRVDTRRELARCRRCSPKIRQEPSAPTDSDLCRSQFEFYRSSFETQADLTATVTSIFLKQTNSINIAPLANMESRWCSRPPGTCRYSHRRRASGEAQRTSLRIRYVQCIIEGGQRSALASTEAAGGVLTPVSAAPGNPVLEKLILLPTFPPLTPSACRRRPILLATRAFGQRRSELSSGGHPIAAFPTRRRA